MTPIRPPVRHPHAEQAEIGDDVHVLRRRDQGSEHLVNETALALWQLCDGATSTEEMIEGVCALFDAPRAAIADDIDRALDQLWRAGLLCWPHRPVADADPADPGVSTADHEGERP